MNENKYKLYVVKEDTLDNPHRTEMDSIIDSGSKDCYKNYFHIFKYECIYDMKLSNITNKEIIILKFIGKSMKLYKLNKELKDAIQNGFLFNQINNLTIKFYSHLRYINISSYLKFLMPMYHRQFFKKILKTENI